MSASLLSSSGQSPISGAGARAVEDDVQYSQQ